MAVVAAGQGLYDAGQGTPPDSDASLRVRLVSAPHFAAWPRRPLQLEAKVRPRGFPCTINRFGSFATISTVRPIEISCQVVARCPGPISLHG
jgi:hypothetical protein